MILIQRTAGNAALRSRGLNGIRQRLAADFPHRMATAMSKFNTLPGRALELATQVGETLRDRVPDKAIKWVETGAALGALKTGSRVALRVVRRNPVMAAAAAAGAGLLWYAAHRRAKQAQNGPIEGSATRIEAKRASSSDTPRQRRTTKRAAPRKRPSTAST